MANEDKTKDEESTTDSIDTETKDKDSESKKKSKKKKSDTINKQKDNDNPIKSTKDALNTISGLPSIDIDDLIDNLLKNTEDTVLNSSDWKDVYRALSSDDKNADINEIIKDISNLDFISSASNSERLTKYKDFIMILKKVPIIKKVLRLYTANILAPDDISKISLTTVPKNPTIDKGSEEYVSIENKFKIIMDKINLEDILYDLIFKTLFYGDMFIEIVSSKRYLLQTLYNLQIPIKDDNIKLTESYINDQYEQGIDMLFEGNGNDIPNINVKIEWQRPLPSQILETLDFANVYYNKSLNYYGINEDNSYQKRYLIKYLMESFFGDSNLYKSYHERYNILNEDFIETGNNKSSQVDISTFAKKIDKKINNKTNNSNTDEDDLFKDKRYSLDYLPVQSTLSSLSIKIYSPDKVIVLRDEEVDYGYLYVSTGIDNINTLSNNNSGGNTSSIGANAGITSSAVMNSSNFLTSGAANKMDMFNSSTNNNFKKQSHVKQISTRIAEYIKRKFEEYGGDVNIDNMSATLQMMMADILNNGSNNVTVRYIPPLNMQHFKIEGTGLNSPYGESVTEDMLFRAKMLLSDDVNGIINKFTNTGKRLVWTVNANTHQQAANRIMQASKSINKKSYSVDGSLDLMSSAILPNDNIFIAKVNGEPQIELTTLDLGSPEDTANTNTYLLKQLLTAADIPPALLGVEEFTSGKNTLAVENVVFAQSIVAYQKQFSTSITNLIQKIYMAIYSNTREFNKNFKNLLISLNAPRGITLSSYAENLGQLSTIINTMKELEIPTTMIIQKFWPELYDQVTEAKRLIEELDKETKRKNIINNTGQQNNSGDQSSVSGGGDMGGLDFGGGSGGGSSLDFSAGTEGGTGGGLESTPADTLSDNDLDSLAAGAS